MFAHVSLGATFGRVDETEESWTLYRVKRDFDRIDLPGVPPGLILDEWAGWRRSASIPVGTPFLISPSLTYDVRLNMFFYSADMLAASMSTRVGYAYDLRGFLNFLHQGRNKTAWDEATEADHRAYLIWRREDPAGPRVEASTWDRSVSAIDRVYRWHVLNGHTRVNPIPHRPARGGYGSIRHTAEPGRATAATYSHGARRDRIAWLPSRSYREWRDVGLRGYLPDGLPDPTFRGRWADRNATFADLMVRTGMRLSEQCALTAPEIPQVTGARGYHRFWLPAAVAKGGSARWIYVPSSVLRRIHAYMDVDRRSALARAQARGLYLNPGPEFFILDDRQLAVPFPSPTQSEGRAVKLGLLTADERQRLLVRGARGWEPAALWLTEDGVPMSTSTWKDIFRVANARCAHHDLPARAHAHMLRHTFAVLTLEQLQRGHIASLRELTSAQRNHYTRVFGDPLDWVRRRLGHRSVTTTQIYLHALEELEMETRMALVSDVWEDPRDRDLIVNLGERHES